MNDISNNKPTPEAILASIREILADVTEEWDIDTGEITVSTKLVDLGMESISLVYLVAELQQNYGAGDRLFGKLRDEGTMLVDMTVGDVVSSLRELLVNK